jgi:non-specific serine/threonine protein kinase/serine/threonine-protein kinase
MFEFHDAIEKLPGSTVARELLVSRALEYLENLSREAARDPRLAREIALGYSRIGDVQGNSGMSNLGKMSAALESHRKAEEILARLLKRSPSDDSLRLDYLHASRSLASAYSFVGDVPHARAFADKNLAMAADGLRAHPNDPRFLNAMMEAQYVEGDLLTNAKKYDEAIPIRQSILATQERIVAAKPGDSGALANLALAHKRLGALYGVTKRYEEGRREYQQARVIDEEYLKTDNGPRAQLDLSYDYSDLGWVTVRLGDQPAALAFYRKAQALRQSAAAADPNDHRAAVSLASITERVATQLRRTHDLAAALQESQHAIALWKDLAERPGSGWNNTLELADTHDECAEVYIAMKNFPRAVAEYEEAIRLYSSLRERGVLPKTSFAQIDEWKVQADKCRKSACVVSP